MLHLAKWKVLTILGISLLGILLAIPNLLSTATLDSLPSWFPDRQMNLGLDLQGGSHLLLEVDTRSVIDEELNAIVEAVREGLRKDRLFYTGLGLKGNTVVFQLRNPADIDQARSMVRDVAGSVGGSGPSLGGLIGGGGPQVTVAVDGKGAFTIGLSEQAIRDRDTRAVEQSLEIIRRRIDETGVREPTIEREGEDRILVQLPGIKDPERVKALIGKTAKLEFHLVDENATPAQAEAGGAPGAEVLPLQDRLANGPTQIVVYRSVVVGGDRLVDAQPTFEQGRPVVNFRFDAVGAKRFGDATRANIGHRLAIVLDGKVISAPVIRDAILGGSGVISGNFTTQQAQDLALLLRAGALPAPLTVIEERSVGPGLGADSILAGEYASALGFLLVVLFMVAVYGLFGLFADLALIVNLFLLIGALSALGATLTLPGIAGIVLTMGMAVDANVLIYERLREEARHGRSIINAIDAGFRQAMRTIIDSNLTTLIGGLLLFLLGTGPVKGFAVTLSTGIVTSIFSAVMLTRLMVIFWVRRRRPKALPI
ncbi:MAG TPA: protein translocase subunit SecD [Alphaproteobacteria bacterium]|nr:protein translocase subunit SecD [Alphaproteobacteria bacterium]